MPTRPYSDEEYRTAFTGPIATEPTELHKHALDRALDLRKFEIDLYWKRAAYFWTFIGATLAGFVAVQVAGGSSTSPHKELSSVLLSNLGVAFSIAWLAANRGSKYWQENWEKHVDMLEDQIQGPLHKMVLSRRPPKGKKENLLHALTGPSLISVSKVNQLISLYVSAVWVVLLWYSLPEFSFDAPVHGTYFLITFFTFLLCVGFFTVGRSYTGGYWHRAAIRTSSIKNESN